MADSFTSNSANDNQHRLSNHQSFYGAPLENHIFQPSPAHHHNTGPQFNHEPQFPSSSAFAAPSPSPQPPTPHSRADDPQFDIFDWFPKYQSCQRYFIDHAQNSAPVQAVAAFINILLPLQRAPNAVTSSSTRLPVPPSPGGLDPLNYAASSTTPRTPAGATNLPPPNFTYTSVSLIPYLRRLVVTGLDFPGVLHGFFGDDWALGVGPLHEQERRNYLFAAKSGGWASVKKDYDMGPAETVPFMRPLQGAVGPEIEAAEKTWSEWLAMEDWMVGPRAPEGMQGQQQEGRGDQGRGQGREQQQPQSGERRAE